MSERIIGYNHENGSIEEFDIKDVVSVTIQNIKGNKIPLYTTVNGTKYSRIQTFNDLSQHYTKQEGFIVADRDLIINPEHVESVDIEKSVVKFKDGSQVIAARSAINKIKDNLK